MRNLSKRIAVFAISALLMSGTAISSERDRQPNRSNPTRTAPSRNTNPSKGTPGKTTPNRTKPSRNTTPSHTPNKTNTPNRTNAPTRKPGTSGTPSIPGQRPGAAGLNKPQQGNQGGHGGPQGMPNGPIVQPGINRPGGNPPHFAPGAPVPPRPPRNPFFVHVPPPRPTPPPSWVMPVRPLSFGEALLGLTFGIAYNASLNYLYSNSYNVSGYNNNAIYLSNVEIMNFFWPQASMFYNAGVLASSVYTYSTGYNDPTRYNSLLSQLTFSYGNPYLTRVNGRMTAQWWGPGGNYVTLQYEPTFNSMGQLRYYTTLTFGN